MTNKPRRKSQRTNNLRALLFLDEHGQMTEVVCIIAPIECYSGKRDFQLKIKFSDD